MPLVIDTVTVTAVPAVNAAPQPAGYIPHFAYPFQFATGPDGRPTALTVEQDTLEEVFACVQAIVACPVGFRDEAPPFGVPLPEFAQAPVNASAVQQQIARWEPRADVSASEFPDPASVAWRHVQLDVSVAGEPDTGSQALPLNPRA